MEQGSEDLYGDIDLLSKSIQIDQLNRQLEEKDAVIKAQETELELVKSQFISLITEKKTLEKNMIAIYNTAIRELQRKDREILELKERLKR